MCGHVILIKDERYTTTCIQLAKVIVRSGWEKEEMVLVAEKLITLPGNE